MISAVLVTGGAGYIGSHVSKALYKAGYLPVVYDSLELGHRWAVQWGPLEIGNLHDQKRLNEVLLKYKPIAAVHLAAYAYVGESLKHPDKYYWNNVGGSISLFNALISAGIKKLVFSSTCSTYGIPDSTPIFENHTQRPINPYGSSKLMVERILLDYDSSFGFNSVSLRYFNAAGADPEGDIGEAHEPEFHLVPLALNAALNNNKSLTIYGTDYPTIDGTCVRDYVHVSDLAEAHVLALKYLENGGDTTSLNLGTGKGFSVAEIIKSVMGVTGKSIQVYNGPRRAGDPHSLVADPSRALQVLGWTTSFPDISSQVEHAWKWHLKLQTL